MKVLELNLVVEMNRIPANTRNSLIRTLTALAICLVSAITANAQQNRAVIRMVPEPSTRISSHLTVQDRISSRKGSAVLRVPESTGPDQTRGQDFNKQDSKSNDAPSENELKIVLQPDEGGNDVQPRAGQRPAFGPWPEKSIRQISLNIRDDSEAPKDRTSELMIAPRTPWVEFNPTQKVFAWAAPDIKYQPLYFEDVALERYGQTCGHSQTAISALRFSKALVVLPNQMHNNRPRSCDYPLGFCRPGNVAPYTSQRYCSGHRRK